MKGLADPEAELKFQGPSPGMLYKHAEPRGIGKHKQCWALDAATLQVRDFLLISTVGCFLTDFGLFSDAPEPARLGEPEVLPQAAE